MSEWTPERQRLVFAAAYLAARSVYPGMGGRFVDQFHAVVEATAKAQGEDPEKLFKRHLATWLSRPLPRNALSSPYAFFAQAWGELADKGPVAPEEAPKQRVDPRAAREAAEAKLAELRAKLSLLEGKHATCQSTGGRSALSTSMDAVRAEMRSVKQTAGL